MNYHIDLQNAVNDDEIPNRFLLQRWVNEALTSRMETAELCIRVVDETEITALNSQYRKKDKPTNVLSFPSDIPTEIKLETPYLGDLVVCASVLSQEAQQQNKTLEAHWAHIIIHGVLHLLGYDHIKDDEAELMEGIEIEILNRLGYANPYEVNAND